MPRNGSGTYSLPEPAFVSGATISSSAMNSDLSDLASAMTASVAKDGQTAMTGPLNMGGQNITNVGALSTSSGTLALSGKLTVSGAATMSSTLATTGAATFASTVAITGATTMASTMAVTGAATFNGTAAFGGAVTCFSTLTANSGALISSLNVTFGSTLNGAVVVNSTTNLNNTVDIKITSTLVALVGLFYNSTLVGNITTDGTNCFYNNLSDERWKLDDGPIDDPGDMVDAISPRWFRWKSKPDALAQPGFMAQQVAKHYPWAVTAGSDDAAWTMDAGKMMPIVIAELQALRRRVRELEG